MQKNVLVIGASSGIGYDLVVSLLNTGHNVYCGARRLERLTPLKELGAKVFEVDVRNGQTINHIVNEMHDSLGSIDIVYSNAGYPIAGPIEAESIENVHAQFNTNVYGPARIVQAVLPHMRKQGFGRIVFTTSIAARTSTAMNAWYSASKHALNGMVKSLSQEVREFNIEISMVEPGCVQTELPDIQLNDMLSKSAIISDYQQSTTKAHHFLKNAYDNGSNTVSTVRTLIKAGFSSNPKLIYQSTIDAKLMAWGQKIIGEGKLGKLFSFIINKMT